MKRTNLIAIVILAIAGICLAQITATAYKGTGITVDGNLDEAVWTGANRIMMKHDVGNQLLDGSIDNHEDASTEFVLLWDDEGFYCGSWNKDDIHNTPFTPQPGMVYKSWQDDGHEWWVSFDFNDVWEDASPLYYGQYGWQVYKGWVWDNGAPSDQYVAYRNDNAPTSTTTEDLKEQGFHAPYASLDGLNFTVEAQWKWSSFFLGSMSAPSAGKELGFNIGLTDNDGGESAAAWLRWAEGNHNTYQGWGKVTISDEGVKIRPVRVLPKSLNPNLMTEAYDILGRRLSTSMRDATSGMSFQRLHNGTTKRHLLIK